MSAYQIYEAVEGRTEKEYIKHCNDSDLRWMRYSGLIRFHGGSGFESTKSILPEIVAFFASLTTTIVVAVMSHRREELDVPSLLNSIYFLSFLFVASWWALYKPLRHGVYNRIKKVFYHLLVVQLLWTYKGSRNYVDDNDSGSSVHEELLTPQEGEEVENGQSIPLKKVTSQVVDRHKIGQIFGGPGQSQTANAASKGMVAIISFALYHAYTFALLSMMVWALLYHSIFGLVLLVLSCTLWMFKDSRGASFAVAPTITVYVELKDPTKC
ncbi:hypothetical protein ANCCEY_00536 [Ancylostoma ceylanicum]|uniref:Piezo TM1-24 domain-containing protein n=1 Tax=Ancylostoma ceylanicum TaxID=53326 RepID=A0A0D6M8G8_9BILA|nr:hypothetical protein ANCCEY_00536 [Ancylostoma ceylanicum]